MCFLSNSLKNSLERLDNQDKFLFNAIYYTNYNFSQQIFELKTLIDGVSSKNEELEQENLVLLQEKKQIEQENSLLLEKNADIKSQKGLVRPSYEELVKFMEEDKTDELIWSKDFDCTEFGNTFIKNFAKEGYISCTTELEYETGEGHILVAVNTADKGLVYLEPQSDIILEDLHKGDDYYKIINWSGKKIIKKITSCYKIIN